MSVLTLAQAKTHLNISGTTHDTELQTVIDSAEGAIVEKCGPLAATATTSRVEGHGGNSLVLPVTPVISLTSVTPQGETALTLGDLVVSSAGVVEYADGVTTFSASRYTVAYSAGRSTVPADLLFAVKELVRHMWETQRGPSHAPGVGGFETTSNTLPGAAYLFPFRVQQLIAPHEQAVI